MTSHHPISAPCASGAIDVRLDATSELFAAYLHQDWMEEFADVDAAVWAMIEGEPRETTAQAAAELRELLASGLDEADLRRVMTSEAGCCYEPVGDGETTREWLERAAAQLGQTSS